MKSLKCRFLFALFFFFILIVGCNPLSVQAVLADQCVAQCYAQENACRKVIKDDPKCGVELTRCLQSCREK